MGKIIVFIVCSSLFLQSAILVVKSSTNIRYQEEISSSNVHLEYVNNVKRSCSPVTKKEIIKNKYSAKVFFRKGRIICKKDVYSKHNNILIFDFGTIEIEKSGKIIRETNDYIRVKDSTGKVNKIYKNGIN